MKKLVLIIIVLGISIQQVMAQSDGDEAVKRFAVQFIDAMEKGENLKPFISPMFIRDNNAADKSVNLFLISKYKLTSSAQHQFTVDIDHGKGIFCTRILIEVVSESGKLYIKPSGLRGDFIIPWLSKEKLCK